MIRAAVSKVIIKSLELILLALVFVSAAMAHSSTSTRFVENRPIRISFFAVRAGEGHIQIAKALLEHLQTPAYSSRFQVISHPVPGNDPQGSLQSMDFVLINHYFSALQRQMWGAYTTIGTHAPAIWGLLFSGAGQVPESVMRQSLRGYLGSALAQELNRGNPDVIVCTMPILTRIVNLMKEEGLIDLRTRVVQIVTDFTVNGLYQTEGLTVVPHPSTRDALLGLGKTPELIQVVNGLPARPEFLKSVDRIEALKHVDDYVTKLLQQNYTQASLTWPYGENSVLNSEHDPSTPLIVIMGGGEGMGVKKIVDYLPSWNPTKKINVVMIAGRNQELLLTLMQVVREGKLHPNLNLIPLGFTDRVADLYQAATLLISKPGGATLAESEATGIPLFVNTFIPGQESENFWINEKEGTAQHLELEDLKDVDALVERSREIQLAIAKHYPDAKNVPAKTADAIEKYVKIIRSQYPEQEGIEHRMARRPLPITHRHPVISCRLLLKSTPE